MGNVDESFWIYFKMGHIHREKNQKGAVTQLIL